MGGPNKLLLPWGKSTVIGTVVGTLLDCGLDVVVVTGRDAELVAETAVPARAVFNARFEDGIGTSIAAGVTACSASDGYLVALGDTPGLRTDVVRAVLERFEFAGDRAIVAPFYAEEPGRPGHPVLFGKAFRGELRQLAGDVGARAILEAHRDSLIELRVEGSLRGIDAPGDLTV